MPPLLAAVSAVIEVELPADVRGNCKLLVLVLSVCTLARCMLTVLLCW
jgi:hypothetical protein